MKQRLSIFWFRRDLRLYDNAGLFHALRSGRPVLPVFIFDTEILDRLENKFDRRVDFIHQALSHLDASLAKHNTALTVYHGKPLEAFKRLVEDFEIEAVFTNHDYEPYARERDVLVSDFLSSRNISFHTYKDQCVFEKDEVIKEDGKPYTVFTPYSVRWKKKLSPAGYSAYSVDKYLDNFANVTTSGVPELRSIGFEKTDVKFRPPSVDRNLIRTYKQQRDYPSIPGTSRLSTHLRFGTISIRSLVAEGLALSETWLNELIWRDFYMMILWHFPRVTTTAFKKDYDRITWQNNEEAFSKWCRGKTGFPIVDAGMRELNATGFMHNRIRMIVSSFLVKDLLIDWRWGEAYFAEKLNDYDLSANNGGWQWAAGSGCDAAPYFRIFNPAEQQKKFDPEFKYIRKWVPEFDTRGYPPPMVDHRQARLRALDAYRRALAG